MINPGIYDPVTYEFYVLIKKSDVNGMNNRIANSLFNAYFIASTIEVFHSRSVYSGLDFLGDVGGLYGILSLVVSLLISTFG